MFAYAAIWCWCLVHRPSWWPDVIFPQQQTPEKKKYKQHHPQIHLQAFPVQSLPIAKSSYVIHCLGLSSRNKMGAGQSQPETISPEPYVSCEERAQAQARSSEATDRRSVCGRWSRLDARTADAQPTGKSKKPSALEQMSRENIGWRNADINHEMRSWN